MYIPFNRLYSSPILKQNAQRQLILSRRSKTQIIPISSLDKIVNGIKYKNVNLIQEEAMLYAKVVERVKEV